MAGSDRSYALNVLADITRYQTEFAKIPGYTDKQAAKAAEKLVKQMQAAQTKAAADAKKAADTGAKSWSKAFAGVTLAISPQDIMRVGTAFFDMADEVARSRDELADTATTTGLATSTLGGLRLAAEISGGEFADLSGSLQKLPKNLLAFERGSGGAAKSLKALGFVQADATAMLADTDAAFRDIVTRLQGIEDPGRRAAMAMEIFGKSGASVMEAVGDARLDDFVGLTEQFGVGTGPAAIQAANDWQKATAGLNLALDGMKARLVDAFSGQSHLKNFTLGFVYASTFIVEVLDGMLDDIQVVMRAVGAALSFDHKGVSDAMNEFRWFPSVIGDAGDAAYDASRQFYELFENIQGKAGTAGGGGTGGDAPKWLPKPSTMDDAAKAAKDLGDDLAQVAADVRKFNIGEDAFGYETAIADLEKLKEKAIAAGQDITAIETREAQVRYDYLASLDEKEAQRERDAAETHKKIIEERAAKDKEAADAEAARIAELTEKRAAYYQATVDMAANVTATIGELAGQEVEDRSAAIERLQKKLEDGEDSLTAAQKKNIEGRIALQKKAMLKSFRAEQGARVASVAMSAAVAAMAAFQPPPIGAGPIFGGALALAMAGLAAAQIKGILGEKPPKFRGGGMIRDRLPDERTIMAEPGEAVLSRAGVRAAGGDRGVEALNRGGASNGTTTIAATFRIGSRAMDTAVYEVLTGGGQVRGATRALRSRGRHNPWREAV